MTDKEFANIFKSFKVEALSCLYSGKYAWSDKERTLKLMNELLAHFPEDLYPGKGEDTVYFESGDWGLGLSRVDRKLSANLSNCKDDHTAWVVRAKNGKFIDFDIGGS